MNKYKFLASSLLVSVLVSLVTINYSLQSASAQVPTPTPTSTGDITPPNISGVTVTNITPFAADISWTTNEVSDGQIAFCTTYLIGCANNTPLVAQLTLNHVINLSGLNANSYYYMWIKSKDANGNLRVFYRSFKTALVATSPLPTPTTPFPSPTPTPTQIPGTTDITPPTISAVAVANVSPFAVDVTWTTNEAADGQIAFCTTYLLGCANYTPVVQELSYQHIINLTGLSSNTYYYMWIKSRDASGNIRTYYRSFKTGFISTSPTPTPTTTITPTPTPGADRTAPIISGVVTNVTFFAAGITWTTNEAADGQIAFCTTYLVGCANNTPLVAEMTTQHFINLSGLTPNTYYYMWVKSKDVSGNLGTYYRSFKTLNFIPSPSPTPYITVSPTPTPTTTITPTPTPGDDRTAPVISGVLVSEITTFTARIFWNTNEAADGQVAFCTTYLVGCANNTPLLPELTTIHIINLSGLTPNTTYYMWIKSRDASGNLSTYYRSFRTSLSTTPSPTPTMTLSPTPTATFCAPPPCAAPPTGCTLRGGNTCEATNYCSFVCPTSTPIPVDTTPPVISNVTVDAQTFLARVLWTTSEPADGQIAFCTTYLPNCANNTPYVDMNLTTQHYIYIYELTPNTTYYMWIKSKDASGNLRTYYRSFRTLSGI